MRKLLTFIASMFITGSLLAGGLVTNTNQSAAWVRLPARNASVGIDAAYFNPAGLMKLENGFHISLSNQSIFQTREIKNDYAGPSATAAPPVTGVTYGLNEHVYKGTVKALAFPSIYAVYKMDKLAFSFGFNPVGGGGGAEFKKGLPSFEMSPSDLVPSLAAKAGVKGYRLDPYFKGSSTFLGFQGGVSYKINDWLSVAAGIRYVSAKNTYEGHLNDIQLDMGGGSYLPANAVLAGLASNLTGIMGIPTKLAGAVTAGYGNLTLAQLVGAGAMLQADKDKIEAGLTAIGVPLGLNVNTIRATVTGATPALTDQYISARATSKLVGNQSADVAQAGSGFAPILSINLSPSEDLNIAIKYEMMTKLVLTNKTVQDLTIGYQNMNGFVLSPQSQVSDTTKPITMFPNGAETRNDMPAMLSVGVDYKLSESLKLSLGTNYFFDKTADYGHKIDDDLNSATPTIHIANSDIIDNNGMSISAGLEYNISMKCLISGGYVWANKGVNAKYQSDLTYGLSTQTFGAGGAYNVNEKIQINIGAGYTIYKEDSKNVDHMFGTENTLPTESYLKNAFIVGVGLDLRF
jgi:long-chain fatty acid transport protein